MRVTTWEPSSFDKRPQCTAGIDGGQLTVVADEDQLGSGHVDMGAEPVEGAAAHHGCLVDHDHVPGGEPAGFSESARSWVSDELGIPVPASSSAAVLAATAVPMTLKPALPSRPGRHGAWSTSRPGLADHQVVAVARGEQRPGPHRPVRGRDGRRTQDLVDRAGGDPAGTFFYAGYRRADDALFGGQELGGGVAPVAAVAGRAARFSSGRVGAGALGSARTRTTLSRSRSSAVRARASSGVTSKALATAHGVPAGEGRSEQGDGERPGVGSQVLVDLPVVERHAVLAGQDPEDRLGVLGPGGIGVRCRGRR